MSANLEHPNFTQPKNLEIPLWRYMDLSKFAALLQKRTLHFARADNLGDPLEGSVPKPSSTSANPDDLPLHLAESLRIARERAPRYHFISCWHMNEGESAAMWKLYSRSSDAVCIKTDYRSLASILASNCFMGKVEYIDFSSMRVTPGNFFAPFLLKRRSFSHECEARAIIAPDSQAFAQGTGSRPTKKFQSFLKN